MPQRAGLAAGGVALVAMLLAVCILMLPLFVGGALTSALASCDGAQSGPGGALPPGSGGGTVQPVGNTRISSGFGARSRGNHLGIDLPADGKGSPIYAYADGVVVKAGPASGFGQWIVIDHKIDGEKVSTVYGHMYAKHLAVEEGEHVKAGQGIARVGDNGHSTGPHLHFEYWPGGRFGGHPVDPAPYVKAARPAEKAHGQGSAEQARSADDADGHAGGDNWDGKSAGGVALPKPDGSGMQGGKAGPIPNNYLTAYRAAGEQYGVPWQLLAGIGWAETRHGTSHASGVHDGYNANGCCAGPMQFFANHARTNRTTWDAYAVDGDDDGRKNVYDINDAAPAAAKLLVAKGVKDGQKGVWHALHYYNQSHAYANDVLRYAWQYAKGKVPTVPGGLSGQCEPGGGVTSGNGDSSHGTKGADPKKLKLRWPKEHASIDDPTTNGKITPRMKTVYDTVKSGKARSKPSSVGCWRPNDPFPDHPGGVACDFMYTPANSKKNVKAGWILANWMVANQKALGIRYVIWQGKIWTSYKEPRHWRLYKNSECPDPSNLTACHYDHVHVTVY